LIDFSTPPPRQHPDPPEAIPRERRSVHDLFGALDLHRGVLARLKRAEPRAEAAALARGVGLDQQIEGLGSFGRRRRRIALVELLARDRLLNFYSRDDARAERRHRVRQREREQFRVAAGVSLCY